MFNGTLELVGKRTTQGAYRNKFKGQWGNSLVDVLVADVPKTTSVALISQKHVWGEIGSHFRIVKLLATSFEPELLAPVFVTEFSKCSLREFYAEQVHPSVVARHILQIGEGVAYLHGRNIIHRNLNPGTISVMMDENVKLSNFDGALKLESEPAIAVREFYGVPEYLDDEANEKFIYRKETDMFSLGCTFFEMLTGKGFLHFPPECRQNVLPNMFYGFVVRNKGIYSADCLVEFHDNRATSLEKRLAELQTSVFRECQQEAAEFIRSLVLRNGNERTNAGNMIETTFCKFLLSSYDTSDSQKWIPDLTPNSNHQSFKVICNDRPYNSQNIAEDLLDFEHIFECPESITLIKKVSSKAMVPVSNSNRKQHKCGSSFNLELQNLVGDTLGRRFPQAAVSELQHENMNHDSGSPATSVEHMQLQLSRNGENSVIFSPKLPNCTNNQTQNENDTSAVLDYDGVQHITFTTLNGNACNAMERPKDLEGDLFDPSTAADVRLAFVYQNIVTTKSPQQLIQDENLNANHSYVVVDCKQNIPMNQSGYESDRGIEGNLSDIIVATARTGNILSDGNEVVQSFSLSNNELTRNTHSASQSHRGTSGTRNIRKVGRPKGSYCNYSEIRILGNGSFQCTKCDEIFENRTKSLRHRTYYLKNNRCSAKKS